MCVSSLLFPGFNYCFIKATYAGVLAIFTFPGMFVSAISSDKFRGTKYEHVLATKSRDQVLNPLLTDYDAVTPYTGLPKFEVKSRSPV